MWHQDVANESQYLFRPSWKQMKGWVATILLALLFIGVTYGVMQATWTIETEGEVQTIGIEASVSTIDWGNLTRGHTVNRTIKVRPTSYEANLTITTDSWSPSNASQYHYLVFSHNYTDAPLPKDVWTPIKFSLKVNDNATMITAFSFDIVITATSTT